MKAPMKLRIERERQPYLDHLVVKPIRPVLNVGAHVAKAFGSSPSPVEIVEGFDRQPLKWKPLLSPRQRRKSRKA